MELTTCARPYAKAAYEVASENSALQSWSDMLRTSAAVSENDKIRRVLSSPVLTSREQADEFIRVCGDSLDKTGQNFIRTLADNKRITLLPQIADLFDRLKAEQERTADVEVISAFALKPEQLDRLAEKLRNRLGREVKLRTTVDDSLIGGVVIRADDMVIDGSVRARLAKLADAMNS
ncbi:F0F1 ATP synthase subunit delta [Kistimonas asteriae]|uniref:F0F1 ATP synthase subunit delta n=1 Tax=Kistimonas asteriae TaxID=517724 RepID=UPI001BA804D1|nr:F0F1 ATP synthase subunit delta [Kistimonas asteriae]